MKVFSRVFRAFFSKKTASVKSKKKYNNSYSNSYQNTSANNYKASSQSRYPKFQEKIKLQYKNGVLQNAIFLSNDLIKVKVSRVFDGDTIEVIHDHDIHCIRLSAIDSPENDQPGSEDAKSYLSKLVLKKFVYLEVNQKDPYDHYNRVVATVHILDDSVLMNVNEQMVACGHAWVMRNFYGHLTRRRQVILNRLESHAKNKKLGLWSQENPTPPWAWRKSQNETKTVG